jgi:mono/diheme cytochrome c family protein
MKRKLVMTILVAISTCGLVAMASGDWLNDVPAREQQKTNPFQGQPQATQAGRLLFEDHCAQCHGDNAQGKNKRPSLRSVRLQSASEGSLHWFLVNGNVRRGMPSWSKLPDQQLWQLVSYLKSLKLSD